MFSRNFTGFSFFLNSKSNNLKEQSYLCRQIHVVWKWWTTLGFIVSFLIFLPTSLQKKTTYSNIGPNMRLPTMNPKRFLAGDILRPTKSRTFTQKWLSFFDKPQEILQVAIKTGSNKVFCLFFPLTNHLCMPTVGPAGCNKDLAVDQKQHLPPSLPWDSPLEGGLSCKDNVDPNKESPTQPGFAVHLSRWRGREDLNNVYFKVLLQSTYV